MATRCRPGHSGSTRRQARRIHAALRRDALALLHADPPEHRHVWAHLQHHHLARIALSLKGDPAAAAIPVFRGLRAVLDRAGLLRFAWHPALLEFAVLLATVALLLVFV
ncbi:DUF1656 domain-containing protein [Methylobacterium sp. ARG-1]|uniref:DUF1656 domain-containing protein n=1 Tax=Methylobacterium sp. ARG-1 TaxID=1692501 RepID=UPI0006821E88|nr:DUF1656 domain-containing protein [Methylobacterium sp. ARG-1]KNY20847.1 hypothetical protein AKJ13_20555 [Methylobacterium sp. ARG-1]